MKFLILGSEGQIGKYLENYLATKGEEVTGWDIKKSDEQDLRKNTPRLEKALEASDFIFFLAFDVGGAKYLKKHQKTYEFIDNNIKMMNNVFELIKKHNKKFIFASSQMVRLQNSNYGKLKTIGESYTKSLNGIYSRFWNVYGLETETEKAHVITDFIKRAKFDRHIEMITDGKELRQFLYADDCCDALYTIYEKYDDFIKDQKNGIDISSFKWTSIKKVAEIISEKFGGVKISEGRERDDIQSEDKELFEPTGEILKYWEPKTSLEKGVGRIIEKMEEEGLLDEKVKSKKPMVSTITPCYKMKPYLKLFLKELPKQTYFDNLEIVLDHNEPDQEELMWVKDFQNKYPGKIKHIIVEKVDTIGKSMNRCIEQSSGEILTIWNVDDLRTPNSIQSQVENLLNQNGDIVIGDYRVVRKFGNKEGGYITDHKNIREKEYTRSMVLGPFMCFKKSLCKKAGYFDEQLVSGADYDLAVRLGYHGKVVKTNDILGYYLNEGKGASTRPDSKQALERTVIEMRYGIFDKIDLEYLPKTVNYSIPYIISFGKPEPVKYYVPNYNNLIENNIKNINKSIIKTAFNSVSGLKKLKLKLKNFLKKYFLKS